MVPGIFAVPMLSLLDISRAVAELNRVIKAGARLVHLCPGPAGGRPPADPLFDPFWAIAAESGVPVVFHLSNSGYQHFYGTHGPRTVILTLTWPR
jgi:predicted TIM-barrel fold metal-dependent hydrolase